MSSMQVALMGRTSPYQDHEKRNQFLSRKLSEVTQNNKLLNAIKQT
jgi:hypothetical protein